MNSPDSPYPTLRQFARKRSQPSPAQEKCELCAAILPPEHAHLLEIETHRLVCSCQACALLFSSPERQRFGLIPRDVTYFTDFALSDEQWEKLNIPINLAFFYFDSRAERVLAMYPSPAGATEATLPMESWPNLVEVNPGLRDMKPDVEALLVNRIGTKRDHFRVPIDRCFSLVGLIRTQWRGLSGGAEVWSAIDQFFDRLKESASHA